MLRLRTLGGLSVVRDESPQASTLQRRPLALLAVLAAAGDLGVTRDKLVAYFWPESDEDRARNVLRQLLHAIRRDLACPDLFTGTAELRLNGALIASDFADFARASDTGDLESAVALYRGPFLDGFYLSNAAGFENWKESERARLAGRFTDAAERVARAAAAKSDHPKAIGMWQRLAVTEPLNSRIAIELMRALAAAGDVGGAMKHARIHETLLREDLGAPPGAEFIEAVHSLRTRADAPSPAPRSAVTPELGAEPRADAAAAVPAASEAGATAPVPVRRPAPGSARRTAAVAMLGVTTALAAVALVAMKGADGSLAADASSYFVLPLAWDSAGHRALGDPDHLGRLLYDELRRWDGVEVVDWSRSLDAVPASGAPITTSAALGAARRVHAANLVWGSVWTRNDTSHVELSVIDVRRGASVYARTIVAHARGGELAEAVRGAIGGLLIGRAVPPPIPLATSAGTRVTGAWRAYAHGQNALAGWDVRAARDSFRAATAQDASFADAHLWLARVAQWMEGPSSAEGHAAAVRAVSLASRLPARDARAARALLSLAEERFREACDEYRALIAADSLDFSAWYGLGECESRDRTVVLDSATGVWRFRGSYSTAVRAYRRALEITPGAIPLAWQGVAFTRLPGILFTESSQLRIGFSGERAFGAFPSLVAGAETVSFVPVPLADIQAARASAVPPTRGDALDHNRAIVRELAALWLQQYPQSAQANEVAALALEQTGRIVAAAAGDDAALDRVRRARALAANDEEALRLVVSEVRLLVKAGDDARAWSLVDSLLAARREPSALDAHYLAGPSALVGRVRLAARLQRLGAAQVRVRSPDTRELDVPRPLAASLVALEAFAAFGLPGDSLAAARREVDRMLRTWVSADRGPQVAAAVLANPLRLAYDELAGALDARVAGVVDPWILMRRALRRGDTAAARATLDTLRVLRGRGRPGDAAIDATYREAALLAALGDTAAAASRLDGALDALPTLGRYVVDVIPQAAAVGRAMLLRAALAARSGDVATSRRWRARVSVLWRNADPELVALVARVAEMEQRR